jgi:hypothetical protein
MTYSITIAGIIVAIIGRIAQATGTHTDSVTVDNVVNAISVIMQVAGVLMAYIARVRKGDVSLLGFKDPR